MCICDGDSAVKQCHREFRVKILVSLCNVFFVVIFQSGRARMKSSCLLYIAELKRVKTLMQRSVCNAVVCQVVVSRPQITEQGDRIITGIILM